jgi:hypothetical protein
MTREFTEKENRADARPLNSGAKKKTQALMPLQALLLNSVPKIPGGRTQV